MERIARNDRGISIEELLDKALTAADSEKNFTALPERCLKTKTITTPVVEEKIQ